MTMTRPLNKVICLGILLTTTAPAVESAEQAGFSTVMNIAGRQRMLTQRITKSFLQIGLGANIQQSKRDLLESIELFERQHEELTRFSSNGQVRKTLTIIRERWAPFKQVALSEPGPDAAKRLQAADEDLLTLCETVVYLIEDMGDTEYSRLVNISGRQRMLSQRMAKFYMMMAAGVGTPSIRAQLDRTINEFAGALLALRQSPDNTPVINEKLQQAAEQWIWLESSLLLAKKEYYPEIVADASEKILRLMDSVTGLYTQLR